MRLSFIQKAVTPKHVASFCFILLGLLAAIPILLTNDKCTGSSVRVRASRFRKPLSFKRALPPREAPKGNEGLIEGMDDAESALTEGVDKAEYDAENKVKLSTEAGALKAMASPDYSSVEVHRVDGIGTKAGKSIEGPVQSRIFYSKARRDRSGAAIIDMMLAHAYAFAHNYTYSGACGNAHHQHKQETVSLIKTIGMEDILRFACPKNGDKSLIWDRNIYFAEMGTLFSPAYLSTLHAKIRYPEAEHSVSLHVRRGDVSPCGKFADRYLPNSHYIDIIQQYKLPEDDVAVFSESRAFESFDDFKSKGYAVKLDSPLSQVWKSILTAEFVVLSKSSFSYIPAMLNPNATVIYTPFLHPSMEGWTTVASGILSRTKQRKSELQATCRQK
jgi:hypothetical protein